jgi:hypothetical protein
MVNRGYSMSGKPPWHLNPNTILSILDVHAPKQLPLARLMPRPLRRGLSRMSPLSDSRDRPYALSGS